MLASAGCGLVLVLSVTPKDDTARPGPCSRGACRVMLELTEPGGAQLQDPVSCSAAGLPDVSCSRLVTYSVSGAPPPSTWGCLQATRANPFASNPLAAPLALPHGLMSSSDAASLPSPESDREGSDGGAGAAPEDSATHGGRLARPWQSARAGRMVGGASSGLQSPTRSTASSSTQLHTSAAARTR